MGAVTVMDNNAGRLSRKTRKKLLIRMWDPEFVAALFGQTVSTLLNPAPGA